MVIDMKRCANDSPVTHVITVTLDRNKSLRKNGRTEVRKQKRRGRSGWSDRFPCVGALLTIGPMQQWPNRIRFSCCNRMNQLWCWCCCYGQHYLAKTLVMLRKRQLPLEHPRNRLATDCQRRCWWKWSTWSKWDGQMKMTSRLIDPSTWMWQTDRNWRVFENFWKFINGWRLNGGPLISCMFHYIFNLPVGIELMVNQKTQMDVWYYFECIDECRDWAIIYLFHLHYSGLFDSWRKLLIKTPVEWVISHQLTLLEFLA